MSRSISPSQRSCGAKLSLHRTDRGEERIHRRHFEACVFSTLANELKAGDVAVAGSENYADYREQLLPWDVCEPMLLEYCHVLGLPPDAIDFADRLRTRLSRMATLTDEGYLDNGQVVIDEKGNTGPETPQGVGRRSNCPTCGGFKAA
jgi:hypothetical protein